MSVIPPKKLLNMSAFKVALIKTSFRPGRFASNPFRMISRKSVSKSLSCTWRNARVDGISAAKGTIDEGKGSPLFANNLTLTK